ncbi:hypothetical protein M917_1482 [Psychrobacter aquaticus CMS 56]|uniref:Uncharacterized protein n=1 Tax=Psychrobacter aquaticus CMS 56 TaxID=1354303 RepID=U4T4B4_9GAMM|nr:hypothetical protein M917_1482 [Psychrobacter aquaticus CMS 56]
MMRDWDKFFVASSCAGTASKQASKQAKFIPVSLNLFYIDLTI